MAREWPAAWGKCGHGAVCEVRLLKLASRWSISSHHGKADRFFPTSG